MSSGAEPGHLFVLAGGQASGKSTLSPHLVRLARGPIVLELDELLDDGRVLGIRIGESTDPQVTSEYERLWLRILQLVRRAGHPVILLCPTPQPQTFTDGPPLTPAGHWARLTCSRATRERRLTDRGWSPARIASFLDDPRHGEIDRLIPIEFRTDRSTPTRIAGQVLSWVDHTLTTTG